MKPATSDAAPAAASRNVAERVAGILRDEIASGALAPDEMLPAEHVLTQRFGVSRPTLREALRILQSEGMVVPVRGNRGGARITAPDPRRIASYAGVLLQMRGATIIEMFDVRLLIEPDALVRVAEIGDPAVLSQLAQNVASLRFLIDDRPASYRKTVEFRQIFLDHCGNEPLRLTGMMIAHLCDRQLALMTERAPDEPAGADRLLEAAQIKEELVRAMMGKRLAAVAERWRTYLDMYRTALTASGPAAMRLAHPFALDRKLSAN